MQEQTGFDFLQIVTNAKLRFQSRPCSLQTLVHFVIGFVGMFLVVFNAVPVGFHKIFQR